MNLSLLLIAGSFAALGIGYFCIDLYRNRRQRSSDEVMTGLGFNSDLSGLDCVDLPAGEQTLTQMGHAFEKTSHGIAHGFEQGLDAIVQTLSHH